MEQGIQFFHDGRKKRELHDCLHDNQRKDDGGNHYDNNHFDDDREQLGKEWLPSLLCMKDRPHSRKNGKKEPARNPENEYTDNKLKKSNGFYRQKPVDDSLHVKIRCQPLCKGKNFCDGGGRRMKNPNQHHRDHRYNRNK